MWTSNTMTFWESIVTFLIGFSIVFICLISFVKDEVPVQKIVTNVVKTDTSSSKVLAEAEKNNQEEVERLAVIISAISEELREPVERFTIVSITEI